MNARTGLYVSKKVHVGKGCVSGKGSYQKWVHQVWLHVGKGCILGRGFASMQMLKYKSACSVRTFCQILYITLTNRFCDEKDWCWSCDSVVL